MLVKLRTVVFGVLFTLPFIVTAQKLDSVLRLQEVVIEQSRLGGYAISKYTLRVDSLTHQLASAGSLADLLRKFGYGHLRGYGPGGLATASFRGTGSSHTAVLWNGINLLSPLSGQLDLSQVPVSFVDDASVQTGGAASLYGNGSIGGSIHLNNKARFNEGLKLNTFLSAGSFNSRYQDLGASWSGKKFISSTKVFLSDSKNDFEYLNKNVFPDKVEKRDHNALHQKGILQQNYFQLSSQHLLTLKFWYQDNTYEVPNSSGVPGKAEAVEKNTFYRAVAGWHFNHRQVDFNYQSAFVKHKLDYTDPLINVISNSTFNTFINNMEVNFSATKNVSMTSGLNYTWEQGLADAYGIDIPQRNRVALFSALKWLLLDKWELAFAFREELVNGSMTPFAPSVTAKWKASKTISFYGSVSRNYRIPTFNDLYWKGAGGLGNPDLKPEISISSELGFNYTTPVNDSKSALAFKTAIFNNNVNDWILWSPMAGVWSPQNVKKVWSRGIETQATARTVINRVAVELSMLYTFTRSTNQEIYDNRNPNELNKQLMFTPMHEGSATGRVLWNGYKLNIVSSYTGKQFTDGDNNKYYAMKAYAITNLWINKSISLKNTRATLICEINNILNADYQSRPGYPMPGRNYKLGITIHFNKPNQL